VEFLFSMGLQDRIVGVSPYCDHPAEAARLPVVGTAVEPNVEKILVLRPDLIVALGKGFKLERIARRRRIRFLALESTSVRDVLQVPVLLADALGNPPAGKPVAARLRRELEEIGERYAGRPRLDVLLVMGSKSHQVFSAGKGSFLTELVELAGARSITADVEQPWPMVSLETVLVRRPEVILVLDSRDHLPEDVRKRFLAEWRMHPTLPAVQNGRVRVLNGSFLMRSGPRLPQAARLIAQAIHEGT
jgi:iron complex transport system substrate-binding protein